MIESDGTMPLESMRKTRQSEPQCSTTRVCASLALVAVVLLLAVSTLVEGAVGAPPVPRLRWGPWQALGPFSRADLERLELAGAVKGLTGRRLASKPGIGSWTAIADWNPENDHHDLVSAWGRNIDGASGFVRRAFSADRPGMAYWYTSCDDLVQTWFDGRPVFSWKTEGFAANRFRCHLIRFGPGRHELLMRVTNIGGGCYFSSAFEVIPDPRAERIALIRRLTGFPKRSDGVTPEQLLALAAHREPAAGNSWLYVASFTPSMKDPGTEIDRVLGEIKRSADPTFRGYGWFRLLEIYRQVGLERVVERWLRRLARQRSDRSRADQERFANSGLSGSSRLLVEAFGDGWDPPLGGGETGAASLPRLVYADWQICAPFPIDERAPLLDEISRLRSGRAVLPEWIGSQTWIDIPQWGNDADLHSIDTALRKLVERSTSYVRRRFVCDRPTEAYWYIGADDFFSAWLDGAFIGDFRYQASCQERRTVHRVVLASGAHELLLKIDNLVGVSSFFSLLEPIGDPRGERHRLIRLMTGFPRPSDPVGPTEMLKVMGWKRIPTHLAVPYSLLFAKPIVDPGTEIALLQKLLRDAPDLDSRVVSLYRLMELYRDLDLENTVRVWLLRLARRRGQERGSLERAVLEQVHRGELASAAPVLMWAHMLEPADRLLIDRLLLCERHWFQREEALLIHGQFWNPLADVALKRAATPRTLVALAMGEYVHARHERVQEIFRQLDHRFPGNLEFLDFRVWKAGIEQDATGALALYRQMLLVERRTVKELQNRLSERGSEGTQWERTPW